MPGGKVGRGRPHRLFRSSLCPRRHIPACNGSVAHLLSARREFAAFEVEVWAVHFAEPREGHVPDLGFAGSASEEQGSLPVTRRRASGCRRARSRACAHAHACPSRRADRLPRTSVYTFLLAYIIGLSSNQLCPPHPTQAIHVVVPVDVAYYDAWRRFRVSSDLDDSNASTIPRPRRRLAAESSRRCLRAFVVFWICIAIAAVQVQAAGVCSGVSPGTP